MTNNRKILFTDLDGTLLNDDKKICDDNIKAIKEMTDAGHIFAVNTGRPMAAARKLVSSLDMSKNSYILSFHGTCIYDCLLDRVISAKYIDTDSAIALLKAIDREGIHSQTFTSDGIYTTHDNDTLREYNKYTHEPVTIIDSYDDIRDKRLHKVMAIDFDNHDKLTVFSDKYNKMSEEHFNNFFSCPEYLEYTLKGADKGDGIRMLASHQDIPIKDTIAVGDEGNDIPMIEAAGIGVCMINGFDKVKRCADYVTTLDNNSGGISEVIYKYIL